MINALVKEYDSLKSIYYIVISLEYLEGSINRVPPSFLLILYSIVKFIIFNIKDAWEASTKKVPPYPFSAEFKLALLLLKYEFTIEIKPED